MTSHHLGRTALSRLLILLGLGAAVLTTAPAKASQGTLTFHATVSGKGHDSGSFSHDESSSDGLSFTGCAVIKQKPGSGFTLGAYVYMVRTTGVHFAGIKPTGPGVYLTVDHFRPNRSTSSYKGLDVSGTFAINGHSYGDGPTFKTTAVITDGGKSGTWTDSSAGRNYPAKILKQVPGFSFKATWHCTTVLHLSTK